MDTKTLEKISSEYNIYIYGKYNKVENAKKKIKIGWENREGMRERRK